MSFPRHSYVFLVLILLLLSLFFSFFLFFFNDTATTEIYTLSLHDALPILTGHRDPDVLISAIKRGSFDTILMAMNPRSEEHTSELQSLRHLVCRLLLEKKKKKYKKTVAID